VTRFDVAPGPAADARADLLLLPVFQGPAPGPGVNEAATALGVDAADLLSRHGLAGRLGDELVIESFGRLPASVVLFVGVGPAEDAGPGAVREAAMRAARRASSFESVATTLAQAGGRRGARLVESAGAVVEGLVLGRYRFDRYRSAPPHDGGEADKADRLSRFTVLVPAADRTTARAAVRRAESVASATNWARDLVNTPAADATPADLAAECRRLAKEWELTCRVWSRPDLEREGFGGILGVGRGSANEPRLVELSYAGGGRARPIAITGKGITFDSGGLSLKKPAEMEWMKSDMAGAATAMAVLRAAAELRLRVNLIAALPFAENLPGGAALRPGDIVRHRNGKTSEVVDTDCEGRLVVADALAYLAEKRPAALVDSATLTDAAGLGESLWAAMGNDASLVAEVVAAGQDAGDPGWALPLPGEYRRHLKSSVADLRNAPADAPDTTLTAAMYLAEFPGDVPWVHIDNGSTAYLERATDTWPKGATGSPTRALVRWLEGRAGRR
jgi:leucyl aminopeptidase